jgi:hypothetical protein
MLPWVQENYALHFRLLSGGGVGTATINVTILLNTTMPVDRESRSELVDNRLNRTLDISGRFDALRDLLRNASTSDLYHRLNETFPNVGAGFGYFFQRMLTSVQTNTSGSVSFDAISPMIVSLLRDQEYIERYWGPSPSPTPSFSPSASPSPMVKKKSNGGAIAGAVIGTLLAVALVVGALLWWKKRSADAAPIRRKQSMDKKPSFSSALVNPLVDKGRSSGPAPSVVAAKPHVHGGNLLVRKVDSSESMNTHFHGGVPATQSANLHSLKMDKSIFAPLGAMKNLTLKRELFHGRTPVRQAGSPASGTITPVPLLSSSTTVRKFGKATAKASPAGSSGSSMRHLSTAKMAFSPDGTFSTDVNPMRAGLDKPATGAAAAHSMSTVTVLDDSEPVYVDYHQPTERAMLVKPRSATVRGLFSPEQLNLGSIPRGNAARLPGAAETPVHSAYALQM